MANRKEKYRRVILAWQNPSDQSLSSLPIKIPVRGFKEAMADAVEAGIRFLEDDRRPA